MRRAVVLLGLLAAPALAAGAPVAGWAITPVTPPQVTDLTFAPSPLKPGTRGAFRFLTSRGGSVEIALARQAGGRRSAGGTCVAATRAPAGRRCLRSIPAGTLRSSVDAGEGLRRFDGTVGGRPLPAGRYRATLRVRSEEAGTSAPATVTLRIAARR